MGIAPAEGDRLRGDHPAAPLDLQSDVRPVAECRQEVAVRLAPGAALIPADVCEYGVAVLMGQAVESSGVAVDPDRKVPARRCAGDEADGEDDDQRKRAEPHPATVPAT